MNLPKMGDRSGGERSVRLQSGSYRSGRQRLGRDRSDRQQSGTLPLIDALHRLHPAMDRQKLYAYILHGDVTVAGHRERNPKRAVRSDQAIALQSEQRFVSRGGQKLLSVLAMAEEAGFAYKGRVLVDVGASTGGFSDCLLASGARAVHTVDVGYNLLDYRIRSDSRVHVQEKRNIMSIRRGELAPEPSSAVIDLSFRSLLGTASHVMSLLVGDAPTILALIKPQFELKNYRRSHEREGEAENFRGIIESEELSSRIVQQVCSKLERENLSVLGLWKSGIRGQKGNQEYFALLSK